ncbi:MAG: C45 family autoproteolytic acyltransferase/hydrolase [bacterium]|jgi:isopenicillin-N N-acyltransferase-like protein
MKWIGNLVCCLLLSATASALEIKYNQNPIYTRPPELLREIVNGRLETAGEGDDRIHILHVWGTPFEMGEAAGILLREQIQEYSRLVLDLMTKDMDAGMEVLDQVFEQTKPHIPAYFLEEIQGMARGSGVDYQTLVRINMIGEASEWHCSLFGAWGPATQTGNLLQLRSLDFAVRAEIQRYPVITIYHPDQGHPFANIGWSAMVGAVTGMSSARLGISEIGDDYDRENDSFDGMPFMFMLRDILQFDTSLQEAITRVKETRRTTSLMYAIGDGELGEARALQTSRTLCNVFNPDNLEPLRDSHPRIENIVYWGMSWDVPAFDKPLHDMLRRHYGALTPEVVIREILPTVRTGNLQVAIYDLTNLKLWTANARANSESGALNAYERPFIELDMKNLFEQKKPDVQ